ncbi:MAG TPA: aminoglycoside phosphotransferase family protein [Dehalococcoidia bacterium]|nr:aminoglycoside phosphotransferase family protein [Dehalococcoidia bacterium]
MPDRPALPEDAIVAAIQRHYGLPVTALTALTLGQDVAAWTYRAATAAGAAYFLKLRHGRIPAATLRVPRFLADHGATAVVAPLPTRSGQLWADLDPFTLTVYPFIDGTAGMAYGLQQRHWLAFGAALRQVHDTLLSPDLARIVPREAFTFAQLFQRQRQSPWNEVVAGLEALGAAADAESPELQALAGWWQTQRPVVLALAGRFTALGAQLRRSPPPLVLCHADIHPNNLLIDHDDRLWMVDWDEVLYAPKECDLMMGVGGLGVYPAGAREARWFLAGYGSPAVDGVALAFYRHVRALSDIGAYAEQVLHKTSSAAARRDALRRLARLSAPGAIVTLAQQADRGLA